MNQGIFDRSPNAATQGSVPTAVATPLPQPNHPQLTNRAAKAAFDPFGDDSKREVDAGVVQKIQDKISGDKSLLEAGEPIDPADLLLAEEVLFRGWATSTVPILGGKHTLTIETSIPIELDIVDEIVSDWLYDYQEANADKGKPRPVVSSKQKLLAIATYFTGIDGRDCCDGNGNPPEVKLKVIKDGFMMLNRSLVRGDLDGVETHKKALKGLLIKRADIMSSTVSTIVLDIVAGEKQNLEARLAVLMESKAVLPKS